jgi:hypothetical protein
MLFSLCRQFTAIAFYGDLEVLKVKKKFAIIFTSFDAIDLLKKLGFRR